MKKREVPIWVMYIGGGVFFILNITTKGVVPSGFIGGVIGAIAAYALTWIVFQFLPPEKIAEQNESSEKKNSQ